MSLFTCQGIGQLMTRARGTVGTVSPIIQQASPSFLYSGCCIPRAASEGKHQYASTFRVSAYSTFVIVSLVKGCHRVGRYRYREAWINWRPYCNNLSHLIHELNESLARANNIVRELRSYRMKRGPRGTL